jgi:peptide/nickel transport system substrate-binding protein
MYRPVLARLPFIAAVFLIVALCWASGAPPAATSPSPSGVTLRMGWAVEPDNLNPFVGWASASFEIWSLNYDQLVGWDPVDFSATPTGLATSWEVSPDGRTYTFHLRQGVTWQDGQPFTADDVAFTYNYIVKNKMYAFSIATTGIEKARVVDPLTVQIVCKEPKADLLRIWIPILPRHIWSKVPPGKASSSFVDKPPIVGTGPFQCTEFKKGSYVRMVANKHYFLGAPHVDQVVFQTYQNADTMTADLKLGEIDAAQGVPQAQFDALAKTAGLAAVAYNYRNWDYLCFNCGQVPGSLGHPVLKDVRFRRALDWAIDKQKLADVAWAGRAAPATTILPPHQWFDPDYHWEPPADVAYHYDPATAERLLDEAGYKDTNGDGVREYRGKPIVLRLMASAEGEEQQSEGRLIVGQLARVGVRAKLEIVDEGVLEDRVWNYDGDVYAPDYDLFVSSWDGYFDPGQTLSCFTRSQIEGWNEPIWSSAEYDRLCARQAVTMDLAKRQKMIQRMQEVMYTESPEIPLTYPDYLQAYDTAHWTGWTRVFNGKGPAFFVSMPDTYLNVRPAEAAPAGGGSSLWIGVLVVVALVAAGLAAWLVLRRREKAVEQ